MACLPPIDMIPLEAIGAAGKRGLAVPKKLSRATIIRLERKRLAKLMEEGTTTHGPFGYAVLTKAGRAALEMEDG